MLASLAHNLWDLFVAFFWASHLGFGGGPAIIPLIQAEVVDNYGWMTNAQFNEVVAVTNALPGPIATKLAAYVGFRVASWPGVIVATAATIAPTIVLVVAAGRFLTKYAHSPVLQSMLKGVRPVVTVLIAAVALQWAVDIVAAGMERSDGWMIFGSTLIGVGAGIGLYFKVHPAFLIVASMAVGYFMF